MLVKVNIKQIRSLKSAQSSEQNGAIVKLEI